MSSSTIAYRTAFTVSLFIIGCSNGGNNEASDRGEHEERDVVLLEDTIIGDTGTQDAEKRDVPDAEDVRDANLEDSEEADIYDAEEDIIGDTGTQDAEERDILHADDVRDANLEDSEETDIYDAEEDFIGDVNPGPQFFDPVSAENIEKAFSIAKDEASKKYSKYEIYFVEVQGNPTSSGNSYDEIDFSWGYAFTFCDASADPCNNFLGVQIDYPGWKSKIVESVAIGAYLAESDFFDTIKFNLRQILEKSGLGQATCPMVPGQSFIVLRGNFTRGNIIWFWEFSCADGMMVYYDAKTGEKLSE
jgi:hypothetical protein